MFAFIGSERRHYKYVEKGLNSKERTERKIKPPLKKKGKKSNEQNERSLFKTIEELWLNYKYFLVSNF